MKRARLSTKQRVECFESAGGVCHVCGLRIAAGDAWDVEHVIALEAGGVETRLTTLKNTQAKYVALLELFVEEELKNGRLALALAEAREAPPDLTWFWEIVDRDGLANVPSDEKQALADIVRHLAEARAALAEKDKRIADFAEVIAKEKESRRNAEARIAELEALLDRAYSSHHGDPHAGNPWQDIERRAALLSATEKEDG